MRQKVKGLQAMIDKTLLKSHTQQSGVKTHVANYLVFHQLYLGPDLSTPDSHRSNHHSYMHHSLNVVRDDTAGRPLDRGFEPIDSGQGFHDAIPQDHNLGLDGDCRSSAVGRWSCLMAFPSDSGAWGGCLS
jgi:hypothetical protein